MAEFLPVTREEMDQKGWDRLDFVLVTGDAYVDHPSFGAAVIGRVVESLGYKIAVLPQPDWKKISDFGRLGVPKYGFLVTAGNIDSMVAHYTAAKRKRSDDSYSPGGRAGLRPDRALSVYCSCLKELYPHVPVIAGGIEGSLRRFAHYDYWDDEVKPSVLVDCKADLLCYGMGERAIGEIVRRLAQGEDVREITDIRGTCYLADSVLGLRNYVECASFENVKESKQRYSVATKIQYAEQDHITGKTVIQKHGGRVLVQNPPAPPLTRAEFDRVYELPFMRTYHPIYEKMGGVPALQEVEFSIIHNRGCFGGCNFCALTLHQGRYVTSRSKDSIVREAESLVQSPNFTGFINDVGGPTANFRVGSCAGQYKSGMCKDRKCLAPTPCPKLTADHGEYLDILRTLREMDRVKKVFVRSGVRYDYLLQDQNDAFFKELVKYHVGGQLKVAPEHCSDRVLDRMGKPHFDVYKKFSDKFYKYTKSQGMEQYLVPYLMSSHPGSTMADAIELALFLKKNRLRPEQVQDFYPTPGTISTSMYYTELDPITQKSVFVPKSPMEKKMQRALLQYYKPENRDIVIKALISAGRGDLVGYGRDCLVGLSSPPDNKGAAQNHHRGGHYAPKREEKHNKRKKR